MICAAPSPLEALPGISSHLGVDLRVKRDDLYPFTGGGNKARKIHYILEDCINAGSNWLVTCGGVQSNHARVVALASARMGWGCTLVLHGDASSLSKPTGNHLLSMLSGAKVVIVEPDAIAEALEIEMRALQTGGKRPYEIPGGGHCNAGARAYMEAVYELEQQCSAGNWIPEFIVMASGTGTTQAGIAVGVHQLCWPTRVIGVSVARRNPRGADVVRQSCSDLIAAIGMGCTEPVTVDFRDSWVCGGYERFNESIVEKIQLAAEKDGLILDPTYSGKAFTGLYDLVESGEIPQGSRVLFWHTGGLINLLSSKDFSSAWSTL